jgi:hypothetical protein
MGEGRGEESAAVSAGFARKLSLILPLRILLTVGRKEVICYLNIERFTTQLLTVL